MTRRESREAAMGLIFEQDFDITRDPEEILSLAAEEREERFSTFARELFIRTSENRGDIDVKIAEGSHNWNFERIGRVPLAILRMAACELFYFPEIPIETTVNEALEIAKKFDDESSVAYINGVLGRLADGMEKPLASPKPEREDEPKATGENSADTGEEA